MNQLLLSICIAGLSSVASASDVHVDVFSAKAANVNSFIIFDSVGSLIVDTTRNSKEALQVATLARTHGIPHIIFVTHGHPDHFLGMGALKKEFPDAKILVASQDIKDDIIEFAEMAEKNHWTDDEPLMKPKSTQNPDGFDYEQEVQVLSGNYLKLPGGEKLEVLSQSPPTEAKHETLLFSKDLNALFASDLTYNGVHLWLGRGVDSQAIENWKTELLSIKNKYAPFKVKVYPGHGEPTDPLIFDTDIKYINDLLMTVKSLKTQEEVTAAMEKKYPNWKGSDFLLKESIKNQFELLKGKRNAI